jgi:hypothetical protein
MSASSAGAGRRLAGVLSACVVAGLLVDLVGAQQPSDRSASQSWFVAPSGHPRGLGSLRDPIDLRTALSIAGPARPGDTVWLMGGTYRGQFVSDLQGTSERLITVRSAPKARAILDGRADALATVLTVRGAWTIYRDLEITNTDPRRATSMPGSNPAEGRGIGVEVLGPNTRLVNLVIHDTGTGIGLWAPAVNAEAYGNIVFNNGWEGPDRGHGHGIYAQNQNGTKRIRDNLIFNQFSHGVFVYGSADAPLNNFHVEGNVAFGNGVHSRTGYTRNILVGGERLAENLTVARNFTYYPITAGGENNLGYNGGCRAATVLDNFFAGRTPLTVSRCPDAVLRGNTLYGLIPSDHAQLLAGNTVYRSRPPGAHGFVRVNEYDPRRAHLVVFNWDRQSHVPVDLSPLRLIRGEPFELFDVQDLFGAPVLRSRYLSRTVMVPMNGRAVGPPVGAAAPAHSDVEFGAFLVLRGGR